VEDEKGKLGPLQHRSSQNGERQPNHDGRIGPKAFDPESVRVRRERANLIEKTTYQITDLLTIISGRIEILSDKVPEICKGELLEIRKVVTRGVELNKRLFQAVQACRQEIGA